MRHGLLLINLGTPDNLTLSRVKSYLRSFLMDKRVIDLPWVLRFFLVHFIVIPFRAKRSYEAYRTIWTSEGSPLLVYSQNLVVKLQQELAATHQVVLGMRYGEPSLKTALEQLKHCSSITVLPLYPQYSSAATGSAIEQTLDIMGSWPVIPRLSVISDFFHQASYIAAQTDLIRTQMGANDYILFSYHGIPVRQLTSCSKTSCQGNCPALNKENYFCYRAQCYESSRLFAKTLQLNADQYSTVFQSRLGKTPWIEPDINEELIRLSQRQIKKIVVVCPSFVADCLETLEEIKIRARDYWLSLGGEELNLVPCLNDNPNWVKAISSIIKPQ